MDIVPQFDRHFFDGTQRFTRIGTGSIGGKAQGMASVRDALAAAECLHDDDRIVVEIPTLTVIATDLFEQFLEMNNLYEIAYSDLPDYRIAHAFQQTELPAQMVGDLRALVAQVHTPLAVRSSSYLEDAMFQPFASVYTTKMIPNNQADTDTRFQRLVEAVKFVYASTFFQDAKNYMKATDHVTADERMAVIIQEVVGQRHGDRYYPHISGVARSYNYYAFGHAKPSDGVVDLALGLGRAIVDEGAGWSYSPAHPAIGPPFNSLQDMLKDTQTQFWAIHMGPPPPHDPIRDTEHMVKHGLEVGEADGVLDWLASTYNPANDRIEWGINAPGPRILNFAPILDLEQVPLNNTLKNLIGICKERAGKDIEIEFAVTLGKSPGEPSRIGFLQVRPMVVSYDNVELTDADWTAGDALLQSEDVLGNNEIDSLCDIVYVKPEQFSTTKTWQIAAQIETLNRKLLAAGRRYILIGFGRWGTTDATRGIPVNFGQISSAQVIVEATLPGMFFNFSQGSHFFHNMTSFRILYLFVSENKEKQIDWKWLERQRVEAETEYLKWVVAERPLRVKVDGRSGRGVIRT